MKILNALKTIAAATLGTLACASFAHDNHGMEGLHWHATDVWGFVALGSMIGLAIWLSRGGK